MAAKRQRVNHWTEQDRDTVDLARLSDRELTRYGSCVEMIHHILRRRIGDACLLARGKVEARHVGGTVEELCKDAAAWICEVASDVPADAAQRLQDAVYFVVAQDAPGGAKKLVRKW